MTTIKHEEEEENIFEILGSSHGGEKNVHKRLQFSSRQNAKLKTKKNSLFDLSEGAKNSENSGGLPKQPLINCLCCQLLYYFIAAKRRIFNLLCPSHFQATSNFSTCQKWEKKVRTHTNQMNLRPSQFCWGLRKTLSHPLFTMFFFDSLI